MALLLCMTAANEYIITFYRYQPRWVLLDSILERPSICTHTYTDLSLTSDFLVLECQQDPSLLFSENPLIKGVHLERKFSRSVMSLFGDSGDEAKQQIMDTDEMWKGDIKGQGVKIAILDSGIASKARKTISIVNCTDFTSEHNCEDDSGHGTFVASLITSKNSDCPGLAPLASVYIYKVFTRAQESTTSWFLEALNAAIREQVDIVNLSNGGIDYTDLPFTDKIKEVADAGITILSAIGNDGPGLGTTNNPGEQLEVIGVGALSEDGKDVAAFSSRGPTLWEMATGMGRVKPDVVSFGTKVVCVTQRGYSNGKCSTSSGTSIATPIVTAGLALALTGYKDKAAKPLPGISAFEQGAGVFDLSATYKILRSLSPHLSVFPSVLNFTSDYLYPFNLQPL